MSGYYALKRKQFIGKLWMRLDKVGWSMKILSKMILTLANILCFYILQWL